MILMSVGDDHAADLVAVLLKIGVIGNDQIDAEHIAVGERHTGVDDDDIVLTFKYSQVLADLIQTAEERHANGRLGRQCLFLGIALFALGISGHHGLIRALESG